MQNSKTYLLTAISRALFVVVFMLFLVPLNAQNGQVSFGQNRVQYKQFKWQFYETDNFDVYFYQGGQDIGKYVVQSSELLLTELNEKLDFRLSNRLSLIVYNDISDMHQTNIGIKKDEDHISGTTRILDNKLFVYFNGSHTDLDRQIKEGITRAYLEKTAAGTGFQEVVQNAVLLNMPLWFTEGLIAYVGQDWDAASENKLKTAILQDEYVNLNKLSVEEMNFVGKSIWHYVEEKYGTESMANLLYLVRINKSVDRGFMFVTGKSLDGFLMEWYNFHQEKYQKEVADFDAIDEEQQIEIKVKKAFEFYDAKLSPNGKYLAYAENDIGRWRVKVYDIENDKTTTLQKGGFRTNTLTTDLSSPMLAWSPSGSELALIYEKRDLFHLVKFDAKDFKKGEPKPMRKFQKVYGFAYAQDEKNLVLSGMQKGQIDVFKYYIPSTKVVNLTNDFYDDLQPSYAVIDGRQGMLFISNRPDDKIKFQRLDTILPNNTFDVFFYDFNNSIQPIAQITRTPEANESYPQAYSDSLFSFLSDFSGVNAQYVGTISSERLYDRKQYFYTTQEDPNEIDSVVLDPEIDLASALPFGDELDKIIEVRDVPYYRLRGVSNRVSNYYENLSYQNSTSRAKFGLVQVERGNKPVVLKQPINKTFYSGEALLHEEPEQEESIVVQAVDSSKVEEEIEPAKEKIIKYQSKFDGRPNVAVNYEALVDEEDNDASTSGAFSFRRTRQYFIKFRTEEVSVGVDNSQLITPYQVFNPGSPVFNQAGFNGMMRFGITDLFENHKIHGGLRFPTSFNGTEVYITYENFKKRWDKSLTYYRKTSTDEAQFQYTGVPFLVEGKLNTRTNIVETQLSYPIDIINSIRFKFGFRSDRSIVKSTDFLTLNTPNFSQNWLQSRVEFVHDHTVNKALNIKQGFRFNTYFEFQKEIPTNEDTIFNDVRVQLPEFNNSYLMLWGFDARHYQKVYKTVIWANRLAYGSSIGTKRMIYYLGGTDNMLFPQFNQETPINTDNNYAYQALAFQMRGFQQNVRNGNSFMVLNSELRVPVFSAFSKRPIKSALLENLQLVGFVDVGTAWEGFSPFSNNNPLFQETISNTGETAIVRLKVQKQPVVIGMGTGLRMNLLGYFVRADVGWGYDTGKINAPRFQVSLGYDF